MKLVEIYSLMMMGTLFELALANGPRKTGFAGQGFGARKAGRNQRVPAQTKRKGGSR